MAIIDKLNLTDKEKEQLINEILSEYKDKSVQQPKKTWELSKVKTIDKATVNKVAKEQDDYKCICFF